MEDEREVYWAAGFLEGEGCFTSTKWGSPRIRANQTATREPLDRLVKIFGGKIDPVDNSRNRDRGMKTQDAFVWYLGAIPAIIALFKLYPLMSSHRQEQIAIALEATLNQKGINRTGVKEALIERISSIRRA